jgi:hypothetical protein
MGYATITGQLKDSDGTAWSNATWTAVPVSPSSKPVFPDGSPVPTTGGLLDATGHFSGEIPETIDIRPPGTTLTVTITSMTSAPPLTLTKVQIVSTAVDLGALLSPRLVAPRIKAAPIVYAYAAVEVTNPVHGNGYINTVENQSYIYMQNSWVKIGVGGIPEDVVRLAPTLNEGDLAIDGAITWGGMTLLPDGTDINTIANGGIYTIANGAINAPAQIVDVRSCFIQVWGKWSRSSGANPDGCRQFFWSYLAPDNQRVFTRFCIGTAWGPWLETAHMDASGGLTLTGDLSTTGIAIGHQTPPYLIVTDSSSCFIDASLNGGFPRLLLNSRVGGTPVCDVTGTLSATTKTFKIPHPLDATRNLIHACLEGPENGVYYRGEAELVDGRAIVELPDYFEALTFPDDRTVLLTQVDDGGELALLAASRVVDGKFSIRSNVSAALVSWEVKAVRRAGVDRLEVEQAKTGERSEGEC